MPDVTSRRDRSITQRVRIIAEAFEMWFLITAYSHRDRERAARAYTYTQTHLYKKTYSKPDATLISVDVPPRCGVIHNEN